MALNDENNFSAMDIDTIGEILNISMGASSTTLSEMLEQRVNITTPHVEVLHSSKIHFEAFEPAIGVEINYVVGLTGKNIMVIKETDVKVILGLLMHTDQFEENFVMDELAIGAMCEVMNQMMGASSTALSQLLNKPINISPPNSFAIDNSEEFKSKYFDGEGNAVVITFRLTIGDLVDSEFVCLMAVEHAKALIAGFGFDTPEPVKAVAPVVQRPAPNTAPAPARAQEPRNVAAQAVKQEPAAKSAPATIYSVEQANYPSFDEADSLLTNDQNNNLNLILSVPLQITVEIGRTSRKIKDILDFSSGTIVELNKQAGSQVDIFVNGKAIAKGDVVVVDDYYGVRITEVSSNSEIMKAL